MDPKILVQIEDCIKRTTLHYFYQGYQAYNNRQFLESVVWGAIFIESFLKDILEKLDADPATEELTINKLINKLQSIAKKMTPEEHRIYKEITERSETIRAMRNRTVHDTGTDRENISKDARELYENNLEVIFKEYLKSDIAHYGTEHGSNNALFNDAIAPTPAFPIFISTITPHNDEQELFIERFCKKLEKIGVHPVRCEYDEYDQKDPVGKVRRVIKECNAVIVLGLERSHAYHYVDKEGSDKQVERNHRFYSSAWLQMESGIAAGLEKPIFVMCQDKIHSEGIFDRGFNSYVPVEIDGILTVNHPKVDLLLNKIKTFMNNYRR